MEVMEASDGGGGDDVRQWKWRRVSGRAAMEVATEVVPGSMVPKEVVQMEMIRVRLLLVIVVLMSEMPVSEVPVRCR